MLKLGSIGDVILQSSNKGNHDVFSNVISIIENIDFLIINLETSLIKKGKRYKKKEKSVPISTFIEDLGWLGQYREKLIFSLANNHIFDNSKEGYNDTIKYLTEKKFLFIEPFKELVINKRGITLNLTSIYKSIDKNKYKTWLYSPEKFDSDSINIVNIHWGEETIIIPSGSQVRVAKRLLEKGADIILGHHSHVVQGSISSNSKHVVFSSGNFNMRGFLGPLSYLERRSVINIFEINGNKAVNHVRVPLLIGTDFKASIDNNETRHDEFEVLDNLLPNSLKWLDIQKYSLKYFAYSSKPIIWNNLKYGWSTRYKKYGIRIAIPLLKWVFAPVVALSILFLPFYPISKIRRIHKDLLKE